MRRDGAEGNDLDQNRGARAPATLWSDIFRVYKALTSALRILLGPFCYASRLDKKGESTMRELHSRELAAVTGAGEGDCTTPSEGEEGGCTGRLKNNNGYGNGAESGPPPGNSGAHNPGLLDWNEGPRGDR